MKIKAIDPDHYVELAPEERQDILNNIRNQIKSNLPDGFIETISYGMIGYVIPHDLYPDGYHCDPKLPLPFMSLASQKNFIALYHMGIYAHEDLMKWFLNEYPKHCKRKLDMGKSCIRFKKMDDIPFDLIGELSTKMTAQEWIDIYESKLKK